MSIKFKKTISLILLVIVGILIILDWQSNESYTVKGRVAGFSSDGTSVIIEHEEIPGYMMAMTMPFNVKNPEELNNLIIGDAIQFEYYVKLEGQPIGKIQKLPSNALPPSGLIAKELGINPNDSVAKLSEQDTIPNFSLINQDNESINMHDFKGNQLLITFIYTSCPVADFCPLMSKNFKEINDKRSLTDTFKLLSITFDPERDTPEVLKNYGKQYTSTFDDWTFVTASIEETNLITGQFSVVTRTAEDQIIHNLRTVLVDKEGVIQKIWTDNKWTPEDVLSLIRSSR